MTTEEDSTKIDRIRNTPGTSAYDREFQRQASSAVQRFARVPLVRVISGLLTVAHVLIVVFASITFVRSQQEEGFQIFEVILHLTYLVLMWWVISMQGRIALYGEFGTELGLFAPRQWPRNET